MARDPKNQKNPKEKMGDPSEHPEERLAPEETPAALSSSATPIPPRPASAGEVVPGATGDGPLLGGSSAIPTPPIAPAEALAGERSSVEGDGPADKPGKGASIEARDLSALHAKMAEIEKALREHEHEALWEKIDELQADINARAYAPAPAPPPPHNGAAGSNRTARAQAREEYRSFQNPRRFIWEQLAESLEDNPFDPDSILRSECETGHRLIELYLDGDGSEAQTLNAVSALYSKVAILVRSGAQGFGDREPVDEWLQQFQNAVEDICVLTREGNGKCGPQYSRENELNSCFSRQDLLEAEQFARRLTPLATQLEETFESVIGPPRPGAAAVHPVAPLVQAVDTLVGELAGGRAASTSCDPMDVYTFLNSVRDAATTVSYEYDSVQCQIQQLRCTAQPASFTVLQAELDDFGFYAAATLRSIHKLKAPCSGLGTQLKTVWSDMQAYVSGNVKRAFTRYQERELCPPASCLDNATQSLDAIIAQGLTESDQLSANPYGCDESLAAQHRQLIDEAVKQITALDNKSLDGFDRRVWIRLGSFPMRLYAILDRRGVIVAEQVRILRSSFQSLGNWFQHPDQPPAREAVPLLQAGLSLLRMLQERATGAGICAQLPVVGKSSLGQLTLKIVDDDGKPIQGEIQVVSQQSGQVRQLMSDETGNIQSFLPKGAYIVSPIGDFAFPTQTITVN